MNNKINRKCFHASVDLVKVVNICWRQSDKGYLLWKFKADLLRVC